ncbi:MAG TPA: sigma-70 family RNA polymerase sigma factor [Solirubrobacterales bacterium]|nr:sigma-70 family RNA polymerase sigma factor [Solirubrobacterales bacterium]
MPPPAEGFASRLFLGPALRTQPDRRLVTLVREGYESAFEEIVRRYGKPLGRYAASIVGGRSEDVLQDAFAKALPALRRDEAEIDLRPWLFRIVRNTALNDLRDNPPAPEVLAEALAGGRNPAEELEQREQLTDLMKRLQALPEAQRAAIVMRELEGLGHDEIAAALGLTDGGARQAIYRARQALRDGAGMLLPLPLLRLLIDHGAEATGAGAGAGGAIAAAGAGAGGAGGAAKLGVVAVVLAGSVGAGVAVQDHRGDSQARAVEPPPAGAAAKPFAAVVPALASTTGEDEGGSHSGGSGDDRRSGHGDDDGSHGGPDDRGERGGKGRGRDGGKDRRHGGLRHGPRHGGIRHGGEDRGGPGPGRRDDGPRRLEGGRHGPGDGDDDGPARDGRHGGGGGGSGPGPGGDGSGELRDGGGPGGNSGPGDGPEPLPEEESGSGSGSGGSGESDDEGDLRDGSGLSE